MNYAVIATSGSQYLVSVGDKVELPDLHIDEGNDVTFDRVLFVNSESGVQIGSPVLKDLTVTWKIIKNFSGDKLDVYKFKAKSRYRRKMGFRPHLSLVEITKIGSSK